MLDNSDSFFGDSEVSAMYFYKDELTRGRVEICIDQHYYPVCDDNWDLEAASVVCRQLGFSPYGTAELICVGMCGIDLTILFCVVQEQLLTEVDCLNQKVKQCQIGVN